MRETAPAMPPARKEATMGWESHCEVLERGAGRGVVSVVVVGRDEEVGWGEFISGLRVVGSLVAALDARRMFDGCGSAVVRWVMLRLLCALGERSRACEHVLRWFLSFSSFEGRLSAVANDVTGRRAVVR